MENFKRHWTDLTPQQAWDEFNESPDGMIGSDVELPLNEMDEPCPWPYEPQQLVGVPMGMYHCPYCGAMSMAGLPHPDYVGLSDLELTELTESNEND